MLNDCRKCGKKVRAAAQRISYNRRIGVANDIIHIDGSPMHEYRWSSVMLKPYPKRKEDQPFNKLMVKWNEKNPIDTAKGSGDG